MEKQNQNPVEDFRGAANPKSIKGTFYTSERVYQKWDRQIAGVSLEVIEGTYYPSVGHYQPAMRPKSTVTLPSVGGSHV